MIVRNINKKEVLETLYKAHGGGDAMMLFDSRDLQGLLFLAHGVLKTGNVLEAHADPYEEIYYVLEGEGIMMVGGEEQRVKPGDAIWIPCGAIHSLENEKEEDCVVLVVAAFPRENG
jgi:mannose-6-phosphate isomerase-like protein (cupin superfamily)